jgi:hypothetical protein
LLVILRPLAVAKLDPRLAPAVKHHRFRFRPKSARQGREKPLGKLTTRQAVDIFLRWREKIAATALGEN